MAWNNLGNGNGNSNVNKEPVAQAPVAVNQDQDKYLVFGQVPSEGNYLKIETTVSTKYVNLPSQAGSDVTGGTVCTCWPGRLVWSTKHTPFPRLLVHLTALPVKRTEGGQPLFDEYGDPVFEDNGAKITLVRPGAVTQEQLATIQGLADEGKLPEAAAMLADAKANQKPLEKEIPPQEFVKRLTGQLAPSQLSIVIPGGEEESSDILETIQEAHEEGQPCLMTFYLPFERISTYGSKEVLKYKDQAGNLVTATNAEGETIPMLKWRYGNGSARVGAIRLEPGASLPRQVDTSRWLSKEETDKVVDAWTNYKAPANQGRSQDLSLWKEALEWAFQKNGNKWHMAIGAYPKPDQDSCAMWEDWKDEAKAKVWTEKLHEAVGVKKAPYETRKKWGSLFTAEMQGVLVECAKRGDGALWQVYLASDVEAPAKAEEEDTKAPAEVPLKEVAPPEETEAPAEVPLEEPEGQLMSDEDLESMFGGLVF